jgi:hypothetical protein
MMSGAQRPFRVTREHAAEQNDEGSCAERRNEGLDGQRGVESRNGKVILLAAAADTSDSTIFE